MGWGSSLVWTATGGGASWLGLEPATPVLASYITTSLLARGTHTGLGRAQIRGRGMSHPLRGWGHLCPCATAMAGAQSLVPPARVPSSILGCGRARESNTPRAEGPAGHISVLSRALQRSLRVASLLRRGP